MLLLLKNVVALVLQNLLNICERPCNDIYEEVIHDVSVISLVRISCWSSIGGELNNSCIQFYFILVFLSLIPDLFCLGLLFDGVVYKLSLFVISKKNINVVVKLYIHLDIIEYVEIAYTLLDITTFVRYRALPRKNFGHVVVLDIGEGLLVIFCSSAAEIMQVVDKGEDSSVLNHEFD